MKSNNNDVTVKPSEGFDYYTGTIYWNNFDAVLQLHNQLISGRPEVGWMRHLGDAYGVFDHAFVVNCGNGWVERDLYQSGIIRRATGMDINADVLSQATRSAAEIGLPAKYIQADVNRFDPPDAVDLAVNVGAMHHVAYIDRATRLVAKILGTNGLYVSFDYVGPHRNQYSWETWSRIVEVNETLPSEFRIALEYPHLKTMLHTDPSEAVHSDLQTEIMRRYFDVHQYVELGGSLAYTLFYKNNALYARQNEPEIRALIDRILLEDQAILKARPRDNLFSFWIAQPKQTTESPAILKRWENEETRREAAAAQNGGRYYRPNALELIYDRQTSFLH